MVVTRVMPGSGEIDCIKEINEAYNDIKDKEILLISKGERMNYKH